ncbi:MAG TPA: VWA domain-containing protein [Thermoanaerobaculia bacterium]|nr:VWA domain-containing protein [Thermoanaerobaculia bacterium]
MPSIVRLIRRAVLLLLFSAAGIAAFGVAAAAPAKPATPPAEAEDLADESTFFASVDVRVVNVEVVVTDKSGQPVPGLSAADFELFEDGKRVEITHFYGPGVTGGPAATGEVPGPETAPAPSSAEPAPLRTGSLADTPEGRLQIAVFVDHLSLPPFARKRLGESLQNFFDARTGRNDHVLLAGYDGGLRLSEIPPGDSEALRKALRDEMDRPARGLDASAARRRVLEEIQRASLPSGGERPDSSEMEAGSVESGIRLYVQQQNAQDRQTIAAISSVIDAMSGLPGRRAVLWVGGGLSLRPAEMLIEAFRRKYEGTPLQDMMNTIEAFSDDTTTKIEDLTQHANAQRVTIYGLALPDGSLGVSADNPGEALLPTDLGRNEEFARTFAIQIAAAGTGGLAAAANADPGRFLNKIKNELTSAYLLSYSPTRAADKKFHAIDVRMRDKRYQIRHREADRDQTTDERMKERTATALLLDSPSDAGPEANPLDAQVEIEAERPGKGNTVELALLVKVPMAKLVLLPQENVHEGKLRIYVGAKDGKDRLSAITIVDAPIRVPNESLLTALGQTVGVRVTLVLRPGAHRVAAGVWDDLGRAEAVVLTQYSPAPAAIPLASPKPPEQDTAPGAPGAL